MKLNGKSAEWRQAETGMETVTSRRTPEVTRAWERSGRASPEPSRDHGPDDIAVRAYMYVHVCYFKYQMYAHV